MSLADSRIHVEHVRGMFPAEKVERVKQHLNAVEAAGQAQGTTEREKYYIYMGTSSDALRMDPAWYDLWREPSRKILDTVGPFRWIYFPPQVRIIRRLEHRVPWHQDIAYQRLLGPRGHDRLVTCWVPLDENPWQRTTVQFAVSEPREMTHEPMDGHGAGIPGALQALPYFHIEQGDCLIFGDLAIHRSYLPPEGTVERRSLEFRLIRPADARPDKDYFELDSGQIVRTDGTRRRWVDVGETR